jgi:hypothetical protein
MSSARALCLALCTVVLMSARTAAAVGPVDIEVAGKLNYGFSGGGYGTGVGARAGVSFEGFYAGVSFVDYPDRPVVLDNGPIYTVGGEVGYGLKIAWLTIRPLLGVGYWNESQSLCQYSGPGPGPSCTLTSPYLEPGLLVALSMWHVLVGLDASGLFPTGVSTTTPPNQLPLDGSATAFLIGGQVGARF